MFLLSPFTKLKPLSLLVIFIGLIAAALLLSSLFGILLLMIVWGPQMLTAIGDAALYSNPTVVAALKVVQIINQVFGLLLPSVIFIVLTRADPIKDFRLNMSLLPLFMAVSMVFMLIAQPAIGWMGDLNSRLVLPELFAHIEHWFEKSELQASQLTDAFLSTTTMAGLAVNILMIAILPALAEEMVFRGVLQPLLGRILKNKHWGIIISALIFAGIHLQFYGFLPRFALGLAFGYLYLWSGNLWVPITAHFINNLLSVVTEFLFRKGIIDVNAAELGNSGNIQIIMASLLLSGLLLFWFYRKRAES